jgi:hypothetical protein
MFRATDKFTFLYATDDFTNFLHSNSVFFDFQVTGCTTNLRLCPRALPPTPLQGGLNKFVRWLLKTLSGGLGVIGVRFVVHLR